MTAANVTPLVPEPEAAKIDRPEYRVYDHAITLEGARLRPGVWFHGHKEDPKTGEHLPFNEWLCGPLHIDATARNEGQDGDYGRLLRFRNEDDRWLTWAMPNELLAGKPDSILAVLLSMGLNVDYKRRAQVCQYIAAQHPKRGDLSDRGRQRRRLPHGRHPGRLAIEHWRQVRRQSAVGAERVRCAGWRAAVSRPAPGGRLPHRRRFQHRQEQRHSGRRLGMGPRRGLQAHLARHRQRPGRDRRAA
jgi:hypothetical protein